MTPEEAGRILADMQESWDSAPCRLRIFSRNGDEPEKMAWSEQLPDTDVRRVSEWAFEKYGVAITLVWDSGASPVTGPGIDWSRNANHAALSPEKSELDADFTERKQNRPPSEDVEG